MSVDGEWLLLAHSECYRGRGFVLVRVSSRRRQQEPVYFSAAHGALQVAKYRNTTNELFSRVCVLECDFAIWQIISRCSEMKC